MDIAFKANLAGAHIGQKDLSWSATRQKLGSSAIIGLTVNIWNDVLAAQQFDVNYLGVQIHASQITKPLNSQDPLPWGLEGAKN
ncbi:MAG: thiamine phosphate synthase [Parachlamydiaceae bacterium]|nr:MAG: thiamine phosphate synthase [Parachlamydiaceae bacterium]